MRKRKLGNKKIPAETVMQLKIETIEATGFLGKGLLIESGVIEWGSNGSQVGITVVAAPNFEGVILTTLILKFAQRVDGVIQNIEQRILLEKTCPHYGGERWWFLCPCCPVKDSKNWCRARILYKAGLHFKCRKCGNITWQSRRLSGLHKQFGKTVPLAQLYEYRQGLSLTKLYYKGQPTKKFVKYLKMVKKSEDYFFALQKRDNERRQKKDARDKKEWKRSYRRHMRLSREEENRWKSIKKARRRYEKRHSRPSENIA